MKKNRLLLTGATGLIGSKVAEIIKDSEEFEIHTTSLTREIQAGGCIQKHTVNLLDCAAVTSLLNEVKPTHILHLAWETKPGWNTNDSNLDWLHASVHMLREFDKLGGKRFVFAGSEMEMDKSPNMYGTTKAAFHEMASTFSSLHNVSFASGRVFISYGERDKQNRIVPYVINQLLKGEKAVCKSPNVYKDYLYVEDVANVFILLLNNPLTGKVDIGSGFCRSNADVFKEIACQMSMEEMIDIPETHNEIEMWASDITRVKEELGYTPMFTLKEGISRTIQYQRGIYHG